MGHAIWCCGHASQVQLLHSSFSPFHRLVLATFMYSVPAVFLEFFPTGFPRFSRWV